MSSGAGPVTMSSTTLCGWRPCTGRTHPRSSQMLGREARLEWSSKCRGVSFTFFLRDSCRFYASNS